MKKADLANTTVQSLCAISVAISCQLLPAAVQAAPAVASADKGAAKTGAPANGSATPAAPAAPAGQKSDPIDIQANEQEFAEGQILAKGNVIVTMKDTIVTGPQATMFRDASGNAQRAVFIGHPHLIQGSNKIDAETLIFEMASGRVIADGKAHSEVLQDQPMGAAPPSESDSADLLGSLPSKTPPAKSAGGAPPGKPGDFAWPTKKSDAAKLADAKPGKSSDTKGGANASATKAGSAPTKPGSGNIASTDNAVKPAVNQTSTAKVAANKPALGGGVKDSFDDTDENGASATEVKSVEGGAAHKNKAPADAPIVMKQNLDKIITDSDHQEYERNDGRFGATGHVRVHHGDIFVKADKLKLVYGTDNKPETALFTGNVNAIQNDNNTQADNMTYFLITQKLQATGNVRSKVIQKRMDAKKGGPETPNDNSSEDGDSDRSDSVGTAASANPTPDASDKYKKGSVTVNNQAPLVTVKTHAGDKARPNPQGSAFHAISADSGDPLFITSDSQEYTKEDGQMLAQGNVHVYYGDTTGTGPHAILIRNVDGEAQKVVFTGRSLVNQPGKRWIGDKITMMCVNKKVIAEGNTRAIILKPGEENRAMAAKTSDDDAKPGSGAGSKFAPDSGASKLADDKKENVL